MVLANMKACPYEMDKPLVMHEHGIIVIVAGDINCGCGVRANPCAASPCDSIAIAMAQVR
jgi:hypothetical protein